MRTAHQSAVSNEHEAGQSLEIQWSVFSAGKQLGLAIDTGRHLLREAGQHIGGVDILEEGKKVCGELSGHRRNSVNLGL